MVVGELLLVVRGLEHQIGHVDDAAYAAVVSGTRSLELLGRLEHDNESIAVVDEEAVGVAVEHVEAEYALELLVFAERALRSVQLVLALLDVILRLLPLASQSGQSLMVLAGLGIGRVRGCVMSQIGLGLFEDVARSLVLVLAHRRRVLRRLAEAIRRERVHVLLVECAIE